MHKLALLSLFSLIHLAAITKGAEVGKVFQINGRAVEITGEQVRSLKSGTRVLIETPAGLLESTIKEQFHTKAKAMVSHFQAGKITAGAKVYLIGKAVKRPDKATEKLIKLCNWALEKQPTEADVQAVIDQGADVNFRTDQDRRLHTYKGYTPLYMAAMRDRENVVRVLLQNGADINGRYGDSETTVLIEGAKNPHIIRLLVEKGADAGYVDKNGDSALLTYARFATTAAYETLSTEDKETRQHIGITDLLLQNGADINHVDNDGETVLMKAAPSGNYLYVKYLVEKGADLKAKNKKGETVLAMMERITAENSGNQGLANWKKVVEVLRELGAPK